MKSSKTLTRVAGVLLCSSSCAIAAAESVTNEIPERIPNFNQVDADRNGRISRTEASLVPGLVARFSRVDRNADGGISTAEYTALESSSSRKGEGTP